MNNTELPIVIHNGILFVGPDAGVSPTLTLPDPDRCPHLAIHQVLVSKVARHKIRERVLVLGSGPGRVRGNVGSVVRLVHTCNGGEGQG